MYGLGKTIDGAKASILEAMRIYIEECRAKRRPVPKTRTVYSEAVCLLVEDKVRVEGRRLLRKD